MTRYEPATDGAETDRRLGRDRQDHAALFDKACHREAAMDRRAAMAYYQTLLRSGQAGTAPAPEMVRRSREALDRLQRGSLVHTLDSLAQAGFPQSEWHPRFAKALAIMTGQRSRDGTTARYPQMPTTFYYPDLPERGFFDARAYLWARLVEAKTGEIREEGISLIETGGGFEPYVKPAGDRPQGDVHGMVDNRDWTTFDLTERGVAMADRVARAPLTWQTVMDHAPQCDIANRAPTVMFSLLKAGSKIPPHTGMINARLICHLPLMVPGDGALRVGSETRQWREGEILVFDDSVEHEAWNAARKDRLVLIFDIWHPELDPVETAQIRALFSAVDSY